MTLVVCGAIPLWRNNPDEAVVRIRVNVGGMRAGRSEIGSSPSLVGPLSTLRTT
jgi:hypothetical protein